MEIGNRIMSTMFMLHLGNAMILSMMSDTANDNCITMPPDCSDAQRSAGLGY